MKNNVKTIAVIGLLLFSLSLSASSVIRTENFEITENDVQTVEDATKAWTLKYNAKEDFVVTIEKVPTKKGCEYLIYTEYFEVSYCCGKKGFGAKKMKGKFNKVDPTLTDMVLDVNSVYRQSIISPKKVSDKEALGLIASYLPELVRNKYKHLIS